MYRDDLFAESNRGRVGKAKRAMKSGQPKATQFVPETGQASALLYEWVCAQGCVSARLASTEVLR